MTRLGIGGLTLGLASLLAGCESMGTAAQSKTVQGGVMGTALGAGAGAIIGNQTGRAGEGAAIGAGLGALGGAMMGNALSEQERRLSASSTTPREAQKICPVGNELYAEDVQYCPIHGAQLRSRFQ